MLFALMLGPAQGAERMLALTQGECQRGTYGSMMNRLQGFEKRVVAPAPRSVDAIVAPDAPDGVTLLAPPLFPA
jgi:hypothetical protein